MSRFNYPTISFRLKFMRFIWGFVWFIFFRPSPVFLHGWRRMILVLFGAQIQKPAYIYPSVRIWLPSNLKMGENSTLGPGVDCYCVDKVVIGSNTTVSQYSYICTASHDYSLVNAANPARMPLISAPIVIGKNVWVAADVFIAPGVRIGEESVVLARSSVIKDIGDCSVASGSPISKIVNRSYKVV